MTIEFAVLGGAYAESEEAVDLVELPPRLARTPLRAVVQPPRQPDRELAAHTEQRPSIAQEVLQGGGIDLERTEAPG